MINEEIAIIISLEKIHRYIFDNIYVQDYTKYTEDDKELLVTYKSLFAQFPKYRQDCADALIGFYENGRTLNTKEKNLVLLLKKINFSRYSVDEDSKKRIKEILKDE